MSTRNSTPITISDLEFQSDRLAKVRGARPEYMDGYALIALVRDLATALRSAGDRWRPIVTAPLDGTHVIIAVPTKNRDGFHIGEAYFDRQHHGLGDWWWAGTSYRDAFTGPVSDMNYHTPTHWQPMPGDPAPCDHDWFDCSNAAVPPPAKSCRKCGWTCGDDETRGKFMVWPWLQDAPAATVAPEPNPVAAFYDWFKRGPALARAANVVVEISVKTKGARGENEHGVMHSNFADKLALETVDAIFTDIHEREAAAGGLKMVSLQFGHPTQIKAQWQLVIADALRRAAAVSNGTEFLDVIREELRVTMLEQNISGTRATYTDGFAAGLSYAIGKIDKAGSATDTTDYGVAKKSAINELAGEASAYTSEVHRAAAQAVSRARLDKSHQTTPSELCVVPAVAGGPANPSITQKLVEALREIEHAESEEIAKSIARAALATSGIGGGE